MNPNTNNNAQNNNKNINNYNNQQKQQMQNQNNQNRPPVNPYQKLRVAYNLFNSAKMDYKNFSYDKALEKFVQVNKVIKETYPYIQNNPNMKQTTDQFHRELTQYLNATENKIAHRFDYRPNPGFGAVNYEENMKREIAQMIQDADSSNKKYNYIQPNNNYNVKFDDVVGLVEAKQILKEIIIIPNLRPDLFTGLRSPPRGLLLFGPPGTGKTMIAKAVATECKCTFFSISASSLTSKYLGESEKLVRALFQLAYEMQPSVVFIDEIESILSKRKEDENDAMKRLKTEFLIQFDGVGSSEENRVLIIGATNRPFDLDPAVIRRLPKRVYVGPFNDEDKKGFIKKIITQNKCNISDEEFMKIAKMCNNYSNSDLKELCREAAYEPLRELNSSSLKKVSELRPITFDDFNKAIRKVRGTLTEGILKQLEKWNQDFGALS